jgi:hypothetical protein
MAVPAPGRQFAFAGGLFQPGLRDLQEQLVDAVLLGHAADVVNGYSDLAAFRGAVTAGLPLPDVIVVAAAVPRHVLVAVAHGLVHSLADGLLSAQQAFDRVGGVVLDPAPLAAGVVPQPAPGIDRAVSHGRIVDRCGVFGHEFVGLFLLRGVAVEVGRVNVGLFLLLVFVGNQPGWCQDGQCECRDAH